METNEITLTIEEYNTMKAKADLFDEIKEKWFEKALDLNS